MKKTILSLLCLTTILNLGNKTHPIHADTNDLTYENKAYQVCEIQNTLKNLFLGNSIYNSSSGCIRLKNSLEINNPTSHKLTFYFKFKETLSLVNMDPYGVFYFCILDTNGNYLVSFAEQIDSFEYLQNSLEIDPNIKAFLTNNEFIIEIDTSTFGNKFTICGDEYESSYDSFVLDAYSGKLTIEKFMLYDGDYSSFSYSKPTVGIGANSEQVYNNNDTISYVINYDNRVSLEEIKQNIIAYDYYDNNQITPTIELDEYSSALESDELGTFSVKLKATDKSNNSSILNIHLTIQDTTNPIYAGQDTIIIHYTDLPGNNLLDLTEYIYAEDNHDGRINLQESYKTYSPKMFETETQTFTFSDISGNSISKEVSITITDEIAPIINGEDSLSIYQYQYSDINDLIDLYTFNDEGSGVSKTYLETNITDLSKSGEYYLEIFAEDRCSNKSSKNVKLTIKDGVGPVFFINVSSLSITNETLLTAEDVVDLLISNGSIKETKFSKCSYITKSYEDNYSKEGTYDTQIVCYDENGTPNYYLVKLNVSKVKSNFFIRFYSSMVNFFKNLFNEIKEFFSNIFRFLKK